MKEKSPFAARIYALQLERTAVNRRLSELYVSQNLWYAGERTERTDGSTAALRLRLENLTSLANRKMNMGLIPRVDLPQSDIILGQTRLLEEIRRMEGLING
jgi:hypothetical protein